MKQDKIAIVLFNLGGPDKSSSIKPFLFNLFNDKAIINLPKPLRWIIAQFIAIMRNKKAQKIYAKIGGFSPILKNTILQQNELSKKLSSILGHKNFAIFINMRYWHPLVEETIKEIEKYQPQEIILLPLYPHFSVTTSQSSINNFVVHYNQSKLSNQTNLKAVCCYFKETSYIDSHVELIKQTIDKLSQNFRILFSAHSLPEKIIKSGDPYQWQIEQTVSAIIKNLAKENDDQNKIDFKITYQSKVGWIKWLGPTTDDEIIQAAKNQINNLVIVPISFVSEHSETLVELDIDFKNLAEMNNIKYHRIPTLTVEDNFIQSLANIVNNIYNNDQISITSGELIRQCPIEYKLCPCLPKNR